MTDSDKAKVTVDVVAAMGRVIQHVGSIPSGELYARLMDKINLEQYNYLLGLLLSTGLVEQKNYLLIWKG